ncbi:serine/threonine-protein kinase [Mesoterricola silvestris]|uniref:Protein kinase domain-containing protein n=1 Tax=Mesoterricola silvestris TaxID=2927979 RepID=A0AA48GUE4_9BACT|nr:serine/threonine-protein kinase [Mesoterricola silvestris]BDU71971.1 hypothetical protein METEAL_11450 [Mesoterricola silvestris]
MDFVDPAAIGRYTVLQRLGAGAMGVVYLAQDPLLKRRVAVKIVQKTRSDSETMIARFQRESEISAQLNHPNIITVFDVGDDPEAGPFLTMEFVDGSSLSRILSQEVLDPETALDWLTQLGQALVAAERAGVVHRDIKPENILVSRDSQLKLTDFGLARDDDSSLTHTGTMMGTPTHTAPELLGGDRATPATDRWAFTVMAFQMVLGTLPFPGETLSSVLSAIAHDAPAIPPRTPAPLARVFIKALHKDPTRRYESILAFLTALAEALGLKDKLVTKGLGAEGGAAASHPSSPRLQKPEETEAFALPVPAATGPPRSRSVPAPPKPVAPLTGPPPGLFKGESGPSSGAPRSSPPHGIPLAGRAATSHPKGWTPILTPAPTRRGGAVLWLVAAAAAVALFFLYPRTIKVQTTPPQAQVVLDGKPVGQTPFRGSVTFGRHLLEVSLNGYDTVVQEISPGQGPLDLVLQPATAWADIHSTPSGAAVTLDGRPVGTTPCSGVPVPDRPAVLVVTLRGFRRWEGRLGPGDRPPMPIVLRKDGK